jgi:Haem-binding domain
MSRTKWILLILLTIAIVIQFIRPDMTPPPVDETHTIQASMTLPPNIDKMVRQSCYDCHSNETRWPWYSQISPVSWWLKSHVNDGRKELNFSEFATYSKVKKAKRLGAVGEEVKGGDMPLPSYLPMHPAAHLTDADRGAFVAWAYGAKAAIEATMTPEEKAQEHAKHQQPPAK